MSTFTIQETLVTAQAAGSTLSNSTTPTSILPAQAKFTLPANFFSYIGKGLLIKGTAQVSNVVTTPGTLTLDVRFGSTVVFNGAAMQMSTTAHTTLPLYFEIMLTARALGASTSANLMGQGFATSQVLSLTAVADSTTTPATLLMPNTAPAVGTGFDSTAAQTVDLFATFSVNTNPTNITLQQYWLHAIN